MFSKPYTALTHPQSEDPAVRWQLNLYKDVMVKNEGPPDPERTVFRVQSISAAVFHLEQVSGWLHHASPLLPTSTSLSGPLISMLQILEL